MRKAALLLTLALVLPLYAMSNGAPNFSCTMCHQDAKPIPPQDIVVKGLPEQYVPGKAYKITIEIKDVNKCTASMVACGGFALQASAGQFKIIDPEHTFIAHPAPGQVYVTHTKAGSMLRKWTVEWIAPKKPVNVVFRLAVIAANGDGTPFGDHFGMKTFEVQPAPAGTPITNAMGNTATATTVGNTVIITKTVWVTITVTKTVTVTLSG